VADGTGSASLNQGLLFFYLPKAYTRISNRSKIVPKNILSASLFIVTTIAFKKKILVYDDKIRHALTAFQKAIHATNSAVSLKHRPPPTTELIAS
jgi:hypothetical protein